MLKFVLPLIVALSSPLAHPAGCRDAFKLFGAVDLEKSAWETLKVSPKKTRLCLNYRTRNANLEITFQSGNKKESHRLFSSLIGFYDFKNDKGQLSGGTFDQKEIMIETWAPAWYKGSTVKVTELSSKRILAEAKL